MKKAANNSSDVFYIIGKMFIALGDYKNALQNIQQATSLNPALIHEKPLCQIASIVNNYAAFENLVEIFNIVQEIKKELIWLPSKNTHNISHYTELNVLKKLAGGESFRLYNANYMNDPEEGKTFLAIIGEDARDAYQKIYSATDGNSLSPAYVGSFIREKKNMKDGTLFFWRTYGKNEGVEAAGACIHFDISKFSGQPSVLFGQMLPDRGKALHTSQIKTLRTPQIECIYRVVYESEIKSRQNESLRPKLQALATKLKSNEKTNWKSDKENVHRVTRELLDEIRFLFKADHYREERELRIVQSRYTHANAQPNNNDNIKIDVDRLPPRFFLEAKNLVMKEVILGPNTEGAFEWTRWLLKKQNGNINVHKSNIPYGKK